MISKLFNRRSQIIKSFVLFASHNSFTFILGFGFRIDKTISSGIRIHHNFILGLDFDFTLAVTVTSAEKFRHDGWIDRSMEKETRKRRNGEKKRKKTRGKRKEERKRKKGSE